MRFGIQIILLNLAIISCSGCIKNTTELAQEALADTTLKKTVVTREGTFILKLLPPISLYYLTNSNNQTGSDNLLHAYENQLGVQIEGNLDSNKTKWIVKDLKQTLNFQFKEYLSALTVDADTLMPGFTHCEYSSNNGGSFRILAYFEKDSIDKYTYQFNLITPVLKDTFKVIYQTENIKKYL